MNDHYNGSNLLTYTFNLLKTIWVQGCLLRAFLSLAIRTQATERIEQQDNYISVCCFKKKTGHVL